MQNLLKVNNCRQQRRKCHPAGVFSVNLQQVSHIVLMFLLLNLALNKCMPASDKLLLFSEIFP